MAVRERNESTRTNPVPQLLRRHAASIGSLGQKEFAMGSQVATNVLDDVRGIGSCSYADRRTRLLDDVSGAVFGTSVAWRDVLKRATRVAETDATTCLEGESGTGKEVVARFIHTRSPRRHGPFVAINCAALPEQLLE